MRTHLLLTALATFAFSIVYSQSILLNYEGEDLEPNAVVSIEGLPTEIEIIIDMEVTNTNSETIDFLVQRYEIDLVPGSSNLFCWGLCFPPNVGLSTYPVTLEGGETYANGFQGHYMPDGNEGTSTIAYTFFDENNPSDSTMVTVQYKATLTNIGTGFAEAISIYPNPADDHVTIEVPSQGSALTCEIIDIHGKTVSHVNAEESRVRINTADLAEGIYFCRVKSGYDILVSEKIMVQH